MYVTSGTVVMLTTSASQLFHSLLSALVEKRGPSIVTVVPVVWCRSPSSFAESISTCQDSAVISIKGPSRVTSAQGPYPLLSSVFIPLDRTGNEEFTCTFLKTLIMNI